MSAPFGAGYSQAYDALYQDKDYAAECDLIERLISGAGNSVRRILDLGCGTGNHAIPLIARGYDVTGVDRSADMLALAVAKSGDRGKFVTGDVRDLRLGTTFDAVLMMFAVLGYQTEDADVAAALATARRHLDPGGVFLFDVWYGPAVVAEKPSVREKRTETEAGSLVRKATGTLEAGRNVCSVHYDVLWTPAGGDPVSTSETHLLRYFSEPELREFLSAAGFGGLALHAFPEIDKPPDETTWNVIGSARAV